MRVAAAAAAKAERAARLGLLTAEEGAPIGGANNGGAYVFTLLPDHVHYPDSRVAFCNDFGLNPTTEMCDFDLSKSELKDSESLRLLAGCLKGNRTLTHIKLQNLKMELIATLSAALRDNNRIQTLEIISASRGGGTSVVVLPVLELNGLKEGGSPKRIDLSKTCESGALSRVTCGMVGALVICFTSITVVIIQTGVDA